MKTEDIVLITGNTKKVEQIHYFLDYQLSHQSMDLPEIQSLDLSSVVTEKVKEAYRQIQKPVLVEDISLVFSAMGKLPGPLIKWFLQELGNEGLCRLLDSYPHRNSLATVCYGLYDGTHLAIFEGACEGVIADNPRGDKTFGWNSIFIPHGYSKTWAEMTLKEQTDTSIRKKALQKMAHYLKSASYTIK